jgi:hypothetical protein
LGFRLINRSGKTCFGVERLLQPETVDRREVVVFPNRKANLLKIGREWCVMSVSMPKKRVVVEK